MAEIKSLEENNAPREKREKLITGEAKTRKRLANSEGDCLISFIQKPPQKSKARKTAPSVQLSAGSKIILLCYAVISGFTSPLNYQSRTLWETLTRPFWSISVTFTSSSSPTFT